MFKRLAAIRAARTGRIPLDGRRPSIPAVRDAGGTPAESGTVAPGSATPLPAPLDPGSPPDYFGAVPNFAYSPLPVLDRAGRVVPGTGVRKFFDSLPGLGTGRQNELGSYLPVAVPDTSTYPGCDYYEIGLQQYSQRLHPDLPATRLRGYRQLNNGTDGDGHNTVSPPGRVHYLGPVIMACRDRPVRIKLINQLPVGPAGELFLPVDPTLPGAGTGPLGGTERYPQNRAAPRLHGAVTPWISSGTPDQWCTPAGEHTAYPTGPSLAQVPDMPAPGAGALSLYHPNQQSGRLMFLRDNTLGISRLTAYSGQIALYLLRDPVEERLVADGVLPAEQIPLVIEDKTFVPGDSQLAAQDPTWDRARWGARGSLWFPHVYQPNQNPYHSSGINPTGRWDYGPWTGPATAGGAPVPNPRHDPVTAPEQPPLVPALPHPCAVPEAYLDTPLVNGAAYPYLRVQPKAYRFRVLNACSDRGLNLQIYHARSDQEMWHPDGRLRDADAGEVPMVPAVPGSQLPSGWPTDGRTGGVPDPDAAGPAIVQIGTDGGLLPAPVVLPNQPVDYVYDRRDPAVLTVRRHTLLLGPGERADVVIDFSSVPPGSTLILYNDCPAPLPAFDPRYDHYTGGPDQTDRGGPPPTHPGYGPNTRTIMQFRVAGTPAPPYDLANLRTRLAQAYGASQPPPIVPQPEYDEAFGTDSTPTRVPVTARSVSFVPAGASTPVTLPVQQRAIVEHFEPGYGRLVNALGVAGPDVAPLPLGYADPPSEELLVTDPTAAVGTATEDAALWRISNHGTATDFVHLPGADVQVVNRTGRDGSIRPPAATELGWRDTVRIDPAQDVVVAIRARVPDPLPFKVGDNLRCYDPTRPAADGTGPEHLRSDGGGLLQIDPESGIPVPVANRRSNLGWTYSWHSQLLGRQAHGMLRPLVLRVSPAPPTGLAATALPGSATALPGIALRWTNTAARPAATANLIQRAPDSRFTSDVTEIPAAATATGHTDSTVTPGVTYYYRIRAENAAGYSAWAVAGPVCVHLLAPAGLAVTVPAAAPLRTSLTWVNRSFTAGVEIQRATNPTFTAGTVTWSRPAGVSHLDETVKVRATYYYRVRTHYRGAVSPWSNVAAVTTPGPPLAPTRVTATASVIAEGPATVELSWVDSSGGQVGGYLIQRADNAAFTTGVATYTVIGTGHSFSNTGLARGVVHHYRIRTFNPAGTSEFSAPVTVTTPA